MNFPRSSRTRSKDLATNDSIQFDPRTLEQTRSTARLYRFFPWDARGRWSRPGPYLHNKGPISATNHVSEGRGGEEGRENEPVLHNRKRRIRFCFRCAANVVGPRSTGDQLNIGRKTRRCGETTTGREYEIFESKRYRIEEEIDRKIGEHWANDEMGE